MYVYLHLSGYSWGFEENEQQVKWKLMRGVDIQGPNLIFKDPRNLVSPIFTAGGSGTLTLSLVLPVSTY